MKNPNQIINYNTNKSNRKDGSTKRKEVIDIRTDIVAAQMEIATQLETKTVDQLMSAHCNDDVNKAVLFVKWHKAHQDVKFRDFDKLYSGFYDKSTYSRMVRYCNLVYKYTQLQNIPERSLRSLIIKLTRMPNETQADILNQLTGFIDAIEKLTPRDLRNKIAELLKPYKVKQEKPIVFSRRIVSELEGKSQEEQIAILSEILSIAQGKMEELQGNPKHANKSHEAETLADKIQKLLKPQYADTQEKRDVVNTIMRELKLDNIENYTGNAMNDNMALGWKLLNGTLKVSEFANVQNYDDVHEIAVKVLGPKISSKKREVA